MSNNKGIRNRMIQKYGKRCMIEAAGIRCIPIEKRRKIKGYKKQQDQLQYHHIKERKDGGPSTEENGAVIKGYNHAWLHQLPESKKQEVNEALQRYKMNIALLLNGTVDYVEQIELSFEPDDEIIIPVYETTEEDRKKFNRAKQKRQTRREIEEYYMDPDEYDDYYLE